MTSLENQYNRFKSFLPRVTPFYAMKCNNDPMILKKLYSLGCGFDCASKGELEQVTNELEVDPEKIIFANPCKVISHIQYAKQINAKKTTFDCVDELLKIKQYYPEANVILRLATKDQDSKCPLSIVYGAHKSKWETLIKTCKDLELNLIGVSFHIGSGSHNPFNFEDAIKNASRAFELAETYGFNMTFLDLGGGFPGLSEDKTVLPFEEFAGEVNHSLDKYFGNRPNLQIIAEPGRYFANGSMYIFLKVINKRLVRYNEQNENNREINQLLEKYGLPKETSQSETESYDYFINQTTSLLFNLTIMEGSNETIHTMTNQADEKTYLSNVYGYSSVKKDQLQMNIMLPILNIGDYIFYKNMGSYSTAYAQGSSLNGYDIGSKKHYFEYEVSNEHMV